jgi:hypothetical protein
MVDSTNDILTPTALILPNVAGQGSINISGSIGISGAKLYFSNGTSWELVTSA